MDMLVTTPQSEIDTSRKEGEAVEQSDLDIMKKAKLQNHFLDKIGHNSWARILEVFIQGRELGFCVMDLTEETGMPESTIRRGINYLIKKAYISQIHKEKNTFFYSLDYHPIVKHYIRIYDKIINAEMNKMDEMNKTNDKKNI